MFSMVKNSIPILLVVHLLISADLLGQDIKTLETTVSFNLMDINGRPMKPAQQFVSEGSPYFYETYTRSELTSVNNQTYKDVWVKYNVSDRQVQYLGQDGTEMILETPVKAIRFFDMVQADGTTTEILLRTEAGALNIPGGNIFQVLETGKASLAKKIEIDWSDEKPYGEVNITRHYKRKETPFVLLPNGEVKKLEKTKDFITELLNDKKQEITGFISTNNIRCKSLEDFQKIIGFYNSLQ